LRPYFCSAVHHRQISKETDLIYEGIATNVSFFIHLRPDTSKETDLIYEGIATPSVIYRINYPHLDKETDLIYEGIATRRS